MRYLIVIFTTTMGVMADTIPADHLITWQGNVGVPGGIPAYRTNLIDVTQAPYNADNTGASDTHTAIQNAINAAHSNDVIYLPAGTYRVNSGLSMPYNIKGITLRGAGTNTTIMSYTDRVITMGSAVGFIYGSNTVTAGLTKGSTNISIPNTSTFYSVGGIMQITPTNDPAIPVVNVYGGGNDRQEQKVITAVTSSNVTFWPPLYADYSSLDTKCWSEYIFHADMIGVEDLVINATNAPSGFTILFNACYASWIKNVTIRFSKSIHMNTSYLCNCEIRDSYLDRLTSTGTSHAGIIMYYCSGCLIENNVIYQANPCIEVDAGSSGNVFGYNFIYNQDNSYGIDSNHIPHNNYNLFEGNIANEFTSDAYFGSDSDETLYRNWFHGQITNGPALIQAILKINKIARRFNVVGNIIGSGSPNTMTNDGVLLGSPNVNSASSMGFGPPWALIWSNGPGTMSKTGNVVTTTSPVFTPDTVFDPNNGTISNGIVLNWKNWAVMAPIDGWSGSIRRFNIDSNNVQGYISSTQVMVDESATSYTNIPYRLTPGPGGYQEIDTNVAQTIIRLGNYNFGSNAIPAAESLGTNNLVNSYYLASAPNWFTGYTWPPFNPSNTASLNFSLIPAGARFTGTNTPPGPIILAGFGADVTSGTVPLTVNFSDASTGATNWSWNFGDGHTSTATNPPNTYSNSGIYTVSQTVIGPGGTNTMIQPGYITVNPNQVVLNIGSLKAGTIIKSQ